VLNRFPEVVCRLKAILERFAKCSQLHRSVLHR
jgi:hypothetical protein